MINLKIIFTVFILLIFAIFIITDLSNILIYLLCLVQLIITVLIISKTVIEKRLIEITQPLNIVTIILFIAFVVNTIVAVRASNAEDILPNSAGLFHLIPFVQFYVIVALIMMYVGYYYLGIQKKRKSIRPNIEIIWPEKQMKILSYFLIVVTLLTVYDKIVTNTLFFSNELRENLSSSTVFTRFLSIIGFRGGVFSLFGGLPFLALASSRSSNRTIHFAYYFTLVVYLTLGIISSQKEIIASLFIILFFKAYYFNKNGMTISKEIKVLTLFVIFSFIGFIFFNNYRNMFYVYGFITSPQDFIFFFDQILAEVNIESFNIIFRRFDYLNIFLTVVLKTPEIIAYKLGETYLLGFDSLTLLIPGVQLSEGIGAYNNIFAREYDLIYFHDTVTGVSLPFYIEAYLNLGFIGIIIISVLYGMFCRKMYDLFSNSHSSNIRMIGFFLFYIWVFQFTGFAFSTAVLVTTRTIIGVTLLLIILNVGLPINKRIKPSTTIL